MGIYMTVFWLSRIWGNKPNEAIFISWRWKSALFVRPNTFCGPSTICHSLRWGRRTDKMLFVWSIVKGGTEGRSLNCSTWHKRLRKLTFWRPVFSWNLSTISKAVWILTLPRPSRSRIGRFSQFCGVNWIFCNFSLSCCWERPGRVKASTKRRWAFVLGTGRMYRFRLVR